MMKTKVERLNWVDFAKGIGILLVLLGHSYFIPRKILCYIYSFHMPLFIFLSGFLFKYESNLQVFLDKKIKKTIIPYILFFVLLLISLEVKNFLIFNKNITAGTALNILFLKPGFVYSIWFLISLLFIEIAFDFILKVTGKEKKYIIIITSLIILFSCIYFTFINKVLFLQFQYIFSLLPFFSLGYLVKESEYTNFFAKNRFILFNVFLSICLFFIKITYFTDYTSITSNAYGNIVLFYLLAITSIFYIIGICQKLKYNKFINYIGKNSLVYFALQQSLVTIPLSIVFIKFGIDINMMNLVTKLFLMTIDLGFNILILTIANEIINNTSLRMLIGKN